MPRAAKPETSPNGSMNTVVPSALRRNADCPYHSTCMLLLYAAERGGHGLFVVLIAAAAHQRRGRGNEARHDRERERLVQPRPERTGDQVREERMPGDRGAVVRRQRRERVRADQVLDRVVAEERGEQDR